MANPYTEVSISNYNANPPTDDGSETSDNQITWAKGKTKLTDPIKTAFESTQTNLTTAFGKLPFSDKVSVSGAHNQAAGDRGKMYDCTNSPTITLLAATTAGAGFTFGVVNTGAGTVTLDGSGSETINGSTTLNLLPGESGMFVCDGSNWVGMAVTLAELGVTSTAAELNILDGATLTLAELNQLDESARTVSGYQSGAITYINQPSVLLSVESALTEDTWETVGPTSSGAANVWTALDDAPTGVKAYIIRCVLQVSGSASGSLYGLRVWAVKNGDTENTDFTTMRAADRFRNSTGSSETWQWAGEFIVECDASGLIDLKWSSDYGVTPTSPTVNFYLSGFIV